tara:strand:+ start:229 stop:483 length:255 start_codon:yes stop_codon:yes gene_type:complete
MKTINELKSNLTELEFTMLESIVGAYNINNNICYDYKLTASEKGIVGNLIKKELIYDSCDLTIGLKSNFFPADLILDIYGLEHY